VSRDKTKRWSQKNSVAGDKVAKNMKVVSQKGELTEISGYQCFRYDLTMENYGVIGFRVARFKIDSHLMRMHGAIAGTCGENVIWSNGSTRYRAD
jgi:hypothetical protein